MKFSESWLRTFVNPDISGEAFSHLLTMAGLEVEEENTVAPPFHGVCVAHVLDVTKHPDADRLNVCRVEVGHGEIRQIVCGAPNVAAGLKVPCALPGALLPGDFHIRETKVRGVNSGGMLCSAKELGISQDGAGLLILPDEAPIGKDLRHYLDLDDRLLTLKLTPNRADCLSIEGIAREVAALTESPLYLKDVTAAPVTLTDSRPIVLEDSTGCPYYAGRIIRGINAHAKTPEWMKQRIERSGLRAISALVDITNYVMLELGQPLHAFDDATLDGAIHVRKARAGETLLLLNESTLSLSDDILMIADEKKTIAMAGIMGGEETGITLNTQSMFLESAFFTPTAVAGRARRYGFGSDASHRFERGVDFGNTRRALEYATALILSICGGDAGPITEAKASLPERAPVRLRTSRVKKLLGLYLTPETIQTYLTRLHLSPVREGDDFIVTPPSYRFDITIEADLIEELARLHGYDNIPTPPPQAALKMLPETEDRRTKKRLREMLADRGFQEVINFSFVDAEWETDFSNNTNPIRLANPIASHMSVMRSSLIGGLLANTVTNLKRKQNRIRVFEMGRCFLRDTIGDAIPGFAQPWRLGVLAYGSAAAEQWGYADRPVDFYDLKGELEQLCAPTPLRFEKASHPALHPGRSARVLINETPIGWLGELHPQWQQKLGLPLAPIVAEIDLEVLLTRKLPQFTEISKQPPVFRDLAIVINQDIPLQNLLDRIHEKAPPLVQDCTLFDVYTGKGVPDSKKSLAFRIVMQDTERTLQDTEVDTIVQTLLDDLYTHFGATLRV